MVLTNILLATILAVNLSQLLTSPSQFQFEELKCIIADNTLREWLREK